MKIIRIKIKLIKARVDGEGMQSCKVKSLVVWHESAGLNGCYARVSFFYIYIYIYRISIKAKGWLSATQDSPTILAAVATIPAYGVCALISQ